MAIPDATFFQDLQQVDTPTTAGPCAMPILYRDASLLGVFFRVDPAAAAPFLDDTPFEPWVIAGRAVVLLVGFEYRDTSVGVYNEVGLAIQAKRRGTSPSLWRLVRDMPSEEEAGLYVVNLPVTTEGARAAGVEIWGYPKYVTGIDTDFGDAHAEVTLADEVRFRATRQRGPSMAGLPFVTWTAHEGRLLRTVVRVGHDARWGLGGGVEVELLGDGPTASTVKALGIAGRGRALASFRSDAMRAILPHGVDRGASPLAAPRAAEAG